MKYFVFVLAAAAAACGSSTAPRAPSYIGTWALTAVDGAPLPDTFGPIAGIDAFFLIDHATMVLGQEGASGTFTTDFRVSVDTTELPTVDTVTALEKGTELEWINRGDVTEPMSVRGDTLLLTTARWNASPQVYRFERSAP